MRLKQIILAAKCAVLLSIVPTVVYSISTGAPPRHTGGPGDQSCVACHTGTVNSGPGRVEITYSGGTTYTPGQRGRFTVVVNDNDGRARWGFQASPRLASSPETNQAGTLVSVDANTQVECEDGGTQATCRSGQVQFVTHTQTGIRSNRFEFEWTPPGAGAGEVRIYVAGNAANGNLSNTGDRIYNTSLALTESAGPGGGGSRPSISEGGIADSFNYQRSVASNTWISIFGNNLSSATRDWNGSPELAQGRLPFSLEGVSVTINGKAAAVYAVGPGQVNVLAPQDPATGEVQVVIRNAAGESTPLTVRKVEFLPALYAPFAQGSTQFVSAVDNATGNVLGKPGVEPRANRGLRPGEIVQFYATGLGPTNPPFVIEDPLPSAPPSLVNQPTIRIANTPVEILGTALAGPGLYQINARVPEVPNGDQTIVLEIAGVRSPGNVSITIQR